MRNISLNDNISRTDLETRLSELWPVFMYLGIMAVIGITGNILVIIIYTKRPSKTSSTYFIICLATLDLITCTAGLACEIVELTFAFMFTPPIVYKMLRFGTHFTTIASVWTLVIIAFDRYYNVCKPMQQHIANRSRILIALAIFLGLLFSWPAGVIYGNSMGMMNTTEGNMTMSVCYYDPIVINTIYPKVYYGIIGVMLFVCIALIITPYTCLVLHVHKHVKIMKSITAENRNSINTERLTTIFVAITIIYGLSYIPTQIVLVLINFRKQRCAVIPVEDFDPYDVEIIYELFQRTYFINNVANPVIYGIFNRTFRNECRDLLKHIRKCTGVSQSLDITNTNTNTIDETVT